MDQVNVRLPDLPTSRPGYIESEWKYYPEWARLMLIVSGEINTLSAAMRLVKSTHGPQVQDDYDKQQVSKVHLQLVYYYIHVCLDFGKKVDSESAKGAYPNTTWKMQLAEETKKKTTAAVRNILPRTLLDDESTDL